MSIKVFCDIDKQVLTRNVVEDRLIVKIGDFTAEVVVTANTDTPHPALCLDCLLKALNTKPTRKYVRKPKPEPITLDIVVISNAKEEPIAMLIPSGDSPATKTRGKKQASAPSIEPTIHPETWPPGVPAPPDISTFEVVAGRNGEPHEMKLGLASIGAALIASLTLRGAAFSLLAMLGIDQQFVEDATDSEGKRNLLNILKEKGGDKIT